MFSFFKKKEVEIHVDDTIWINEEKKLEALTKLGKENDETIFIAWFDETLKKLNHRFTENGLSTDKIYYAPQTSWHHVQHFPVIFAEHHPMRDKEQQLYQKLGLKTTFVHSSLDEPFLKLFGSEKTISIMKQLGAKEDEPFQHKMISASIKNAQEKLKRKFSFEHSAKSQAEWLRYNTAS